jgi:uncharacterized protein YhaN
MMDIQHRMAEYRKKLSRVFQESFLGDEQSHVAFMDVNAIEIGIISEWEVMEKRIAELEAAFEYVEMEKESYRKRITELEAENERLKSDSPR